MPAPELREGVVEVRNTMTMAMEQRLLQVGGLNFNVLLAGEHHCPLVILLHGFPEQSAAWLDQVGPLVAAGWRVALPDQRGYNRSDKPANVAGYTLDLLADDVLGIAAALGARTFALVGHDWGGMVGWHVAARAPRQVERLAILNAPHPAGFLRYALTHPLQLVRSTYVGLFQLPLLPEATLGANNFALLTLALTGSSRPGAFDAALLARYQAGWRRPGALCGMLNWYRAMPMARPLDLPLAMPVRIIWGDADAALEKGLADTALAHCENGELIRIADATHWLHHEYPERVSALLLEFLGMPVIGESP